MGDCEATMRLDSDSSHSEDAEVIDLAITTRLFRKGNHFEHTPLDHDKASIRLIQILPQLSEGGLIQCSMGHYELGSSESPTYSCLSYTWGYAWREHTILIDGKQFDVRKNLWAFLNATRVQLYEKGGLKCSRRGGLRSYGWGFYDPPDVVSEIFLWIDALCINQANDTEKNHQVQQMGNIYARADMVIVWLGADNDVQETFQKIPLTENGSTEPSVTTKQRRDFYSSLSLSPYWSRAWITQEVILARSPVFFLGSGLYGFVSILEGLIDVMLHVGKDELFKLFDWYRTRPERVKYWYRERPQDNENPNIVQMLDSIGTEKECVNDMDRIHSLLALTKHEHQIKVDYRLSPAELAAQVLVACQDMICICSTALIAKTLHLPRSIPRVLSEFYLQTERTHYINYKHPDDRNPLKCRHCQRAIPKAWSAHKEQILCLGHTYTICPSVIGHLYAPTPAPSETTDMPTEVLFFYKESEAPACIGGVHMSERWESDRIRKHFTWRISFGALVSIVHFYNNDASRRSPVRLCNYGNALERSRIYKILFKRGRYEDASASPILESTKAESDQLLPKIPVDLTWNHDAFARLPNTLTGPNVAESYRTQER